MADNQILFETLVSGLSNLKSIQDDLIIELKEFEDAYSKEAKIVNDRLDNIAIQIDSTIKQAIKQIEFPESVSKDDIEGIVTNYVNEITLNNETTVKQLKEDLQAYITKGINAIPKPIIPIDEIKEDLYTDLKEELQKFKPKEIDLELIKEELLNELKDKLKDIPNNDIIKKELKAFITHTINLIPKAKEGQDGVSIQDIERIKDDLVIILTDGSEKRIALPKPQMIGGGGGTSLKNATSVQIVSTSLDRELIEQSQNILVNATNGNVNITLPNPKNCFFNNRSYKIGITKIDSSANKITILPYGSETISLNESQELSYGQEVLNFITDGINWHIGS